MPGSAGRDRQQDSLSEIGALVLDIDGVLYEGGRVLPGAHELIDRLNQDGTPYAILSNNTIYPYQYHVEKLVRLGVINPEKRLLTAARVTAGVLAAEAGKGSPCYVVGERGLIEALEEAGLTVTQSDYLTAEYVVIKMDHQLTYDKLKNAALAIRNGASFISSNPDPIYSDGEQLLPASGAVQAALEASTGVQARVTGKPALPGFQNALQIVGVDARRAGMLGDQPEIDIQGAVQAGMRSYLILSSLTPEYEVEHYAVHPDAIFENTQEFYRCWKNR